MQRFIKFIICSLLLFIVLDRGFGYIIEQLYFNAKGGIIAETNYAINKTKEDIIILGSSRAKHHYISNQIRDSLGLTVYNAGRDGHMLFYQTALLRSTFKRYNPKLIILDFNGNLQYTSKDYDRLATLLPYYDSNPEIKDIIHLKSYSEKFKLLISKLYRFNSKLPSIVNAFLKVSENKLGGYNPLIGEYTDNSHEQNKFKEELIIDDNKLKYYKEIIRLCENNNTRLLIVSSPYFSFNFKNTKSIKLAKNIAKSNNIQFLDYSNNKFFLGRSDIFFDYDHLNNKGADLFTKNIIHSVKDLNLIVN